MNQKANILKLLHTKPMTQSELAIEMYNDNKHMQNIHSSLISLVNSGAVLRSDGKPAVYSLSGVEVSIPAKREKTKKDKSHIDIKITNELIEGTHQIVMSSNNYGNEDKLITNAFIKFPQNTDQSIVAMKIGLIDVTNSTNISKYKSKISVDELANCIIKIQDIDKRIKAGDPKVVNEIAKCNGKINLLSFASKYCCYHNKNLYGRDDYSILDTVLKDSLPRYFDDITSDQIEEWRKNFQYEKYNDYITNKLDELGITLDFRKRKFDHFIWYNNR